MYRDVAFISGCSSYERGDVYEAMDYILKSSRFDEVIADAKTVLIKPNLMSAREPSRNVTTNPELVRAVAIFCIDRGCTVRIGDSPAGALKGVKRVWENTGMAALAEEIGVELVNFESYGSDKYEVNREDLPEIYVTKAYAESDLVISLPKLKTHSLTMMSAGVKNLMGLIPGLAKAALHRVAMHPDDFGVLLTDLYEVYPPDFTIIDAVTGMVGDGPSKGELHNFGFIAGGYNAAQLDLIMARVLGLEIEEVVTVSECLKRGYINPDSGLALNKIDEEALFGADVQKPTMQWLRRVPRPLLQIAGQSIVLRPEIDREKCNGCRKCYDSCPVEAITMPEGKALIAKKECIQCLCCHELCEFDAIPLKGTPIVNLYFRMREAKKRRKEKRTVL